MERTVRCCWDPSLSLGPPWQRRAARGVGPLQGRAEAAVRPLSSVSEVVMTRCQRDDIGSWTQQHLNCPGAGGGWVYATDSSAVVAVARSW